MADRGVGGAVQHGDLCLRHIQQFCVIEQGRDADKFTQRTFARGQVIHREQRVRLAASEGGLQLNNRLAALAIESLRHLGEQSPHALSDKGTLEKRLRVAILRGRLAGAHGGNVGGELRLLERAIEHVRMGHDDFTPGFQAHSNCSIGSKRVPCAGPDFGALAAADSMPVQLVMSSL